MTTTNNPAPVEQCDNLALAEALDARAEEIAAAAGPKSFGVYPASHTLANYLRLAAARLRATGGEASRIRSEGVDFRSLLIDVLDTCGARGTYDALKYNDAVERAEAALARPAATEERLAQRLREDAEQLACDLDALSDWLFDNDIAKQMPDNICGWRAAADMLHRLAAREERLAPLNPEDSAFEHFDAQQPAPSVERSAVKVLRCCYGHTEQFAGCEDCPYVFGAYAATPAQQPAPSVDVAGYALLRAKVGLFLWTAMGSEWVGGSTDRKRLIPETELLALYDFLSTPAPTTTAEQEPNLREALQRAIETLAASRHLIGKYVPDHHWLPEHDKRIAALKETLSQAAAERPRAERGGDQASELLAKYQRFAGETAGKCLALAMSTDHPAPDEVLMGIFQASQDLAAEAREALASADQAKALTPPAAEEGEER